MSGFFCENKDCEEHKMLGTDEEWMSFWDRLILKNGIRNFFIVLKNCPCSVGDEYEKIGETENLVAYKHEKSYEKLS